MNKKKFFAILTIVLCISFASVGTVAYFRFNLSGEIKGNTSNYVFDVSSSTTSTKEINLGTNLKPYDKGSFNLTINLENTDSDVVYYIRFERTSLPKGFKFLEKDDKNSIFATYGKVFGASDTKRDTLTIYWYWDGDIDDENDSEFIGKELSANLVIESKQINGAYMKNGAANSTEFWSDTYRPYIRSIKFDNTISNVPSTCNESSKCWDITSTGSKKVYAYLVDSGLTVEETVDSTTTNKPLYNLYIVSNAEIFAPVDCSNLFKNFTNLIQANFSKNFNTITATSMSSLFYGCSKLVNIDLSSFNTTNVTAMNSLFNECVSLETLDLSNFNTSKVTYMHSMFRNCEALKTVDLTSFNTSNVTTMNSMFYYCNELTSVELKSFDTKKVTTMANMFEACKKLTTTLTIENTGTSAYANMFTNAATVDDAKIIVNYTSATETLVNDMITTKSSNSNVVKGVQV